MCIKSLITLISDIRNISNDENKKLIDENDLIGYLHEISTKYYKTEILLLPVDNLQNLPDTVTDKLEGVLIYFDSANVSFVDSITGSFKTKFEIPKLLIVYETDVKRLTRVIQFNGTTLEMALDQGKVTNGIKSLALCELEIELKKGKAEDAVLFAQECCKNYGLWLSCITKSMKGQRLSQVASANQVLIEPNPKFTKHCSGNEIAINILEFCLKQVIANASELAEGRVDNESVHQLRVSIRRLRTALQEFKILIDGIHPAWEFPLIDAFRDLGEYRDHFNLIDFTIFP